MYKKKQKDYENIYGIEKTEKYDIDRPMVVMLMPSANSAHTANGYLSTMMSLLRFRKKEQVNLGFEISNVQFNVYIDDSVDNLKSTIMSLLKPNDIAGCKERLRKFNIYSYCAKNEDIKELFDDLHKYLLDLNYTKEEANEILSQIFSMQIVQNYGANVKGATTIIFHIIQDMENLTWQNARDKFKPEKFDKIFNLNVDGRKKLILYDAFGEGTLGKENREHLYKLDYFGAPVLNSIISLCMIESVASSLNQTELNMEIFQEDIKFIIECAYKYEQSLEKNIDDLTQEELIEFSKYMFEKTDKYIIEKYNVIVDCNSASFNFKMEELQKKIYLRNEEVFSYDKKSLNSKLNNILSLMKYRPEEEIDDKYTMDFHSNIKLNTKKSAKEIVQILYENYVDMVKNLIDRFNNIYYPADTPLEIINKVEEHKSREIEYLYNLLSSPELNECLKYFNIAIIEDNISKRK